MAALRLDAQDDIRKDTLEEEDKDDAQASSDDGEGSPT